jgi:hypothetical protein
MFQPIWPLSGVKICSGENCSSFVLKVTLCFGQYGHHQVLKYVVGETAAIGLSSKEAQLLQARVANTV